MQEFMDDIVFLSNGQQYTIEPPVFGDNAVRKAVTAELLRLGIPLTSSIHIVLRLKPRFNVDAYKLVATMEQVEELKTFATEQKLPWNVDVLMPGMGYQNTSGV